ncbi:MAG: acyl-CoA thioesterase [Candidatus Omnitrophota bacterium]
MEKRIYYHDTDAGGVVYYGNYLKYLEESRTEFLEQRGIKAHGDFLYAVRKCNVTYKSPARYGDTIRCESRLLKMTAAQLFFEQTITNDLTGQLLVTAEVHLVCLTQDFKPVAISEDIRAKLQ